MYPFKVSHSVGMGGQSVPEQKQLRIDLTDSHAGTSAAMKAVLSCLSRTNLRSKRPWWRVPSMPSCVTLEMTLTQPDEGKRVYGAMDGSGCYRNDRKGYCTRSHDKAMNEIDVVK